MNALIVMQADLVSDRNRNTMKMVFAEEVYRDFDQAAADKLIRNPGLEDKWENKPGTQFTSEFKN